MLKYIKVCSQQTLDEQTMRDRWQDVTRGTVPVASAADKGKVGLLVSRQLFKQTGFE